MEPVRVALILFCAVVSLTVELSTLLLAVIFLHQY